MFGRRFNDGLHQAIEAKEGVKIKNESKTLATITFQNYFRLYNKLSGMTGTAKTEEDEFKEIYKLDVVEVPTNKPVIRIDHEDQIFRTEKGKFEAVIEKIIECHKKGQPVLVGTVSIEKSELLSKMLKRKGIKHEVLNAKYHAKEAEIVAQAGKLGAVTIATNMAGRGTDIMLGGNAEFLSKAEMRKLGYDEDVITEAVGYAETQDEEILKAREVYMELYKKYSLEVKEKALEVKKAGGLFIIGTERHEARRIDNQLRGRSGRQGDEGESMFFLSAEDDLMRIFGGDRLEVMMSRLNVDENMPIESKMLTKIIESAQRKVEGRNFSIRKNVLNYDDVMNTQREIIYKQRAQVLDGEDIHDYILKMMKDLVEGAVDRYLLDDVNKSEWNFVGLKDYFLGWLTTEDDLKYDEKELEKISKEQIVKELLDKITDAYNKKEEEIGSSVLRELERVILLKVVDTKWMAHIDDMEELKKGIGLRAYGQHNPVVEYRYEGFEMFDAMIESIREDTVRLLLTVKVNVNAPIQREQVAKPETPTGGDGSFVHRRVANNKLKDNDLCSCGSGKKYKKCCGMKN
jgi:preprotein translocase subunit SecA